MLMILFNCLRFPEIFRVVIPLSFAVVHSLMFLRGHSFIHSFIHSFLLLSAIALHSFSLHSVILFVQSLNGCILVNWHPGESASWRIGILANRHPGESASWRIGILANRHPGESASWRIGILANRHPGESASWRIGILAYRHSGVSAFWRIGILAYRHPCFGVYYWSLFTKPKNDVQKHQFTSTSCFFMMI